MTRQARAFAQVLRRTVGVLREANWVTRERLMVGGIVFAMMSTGLLAWEFAVDTANGLTSAHGNQLGWDFIQYFASAKAAVSGKAKFVYQNAWFQSFEDEYTSPGVRRIYSYPPIAILLSLPLALFSFIPALIVWTLLGSGLCFELLRRLVGWRPAALAVVGAPAAFYNLLGGQNGYFTAALLGGGLMLLERHPALAGICFGGLAYKPQMALLVPFALAAGRQWRTLVAAAATAMLLGLASLALFGSESWFGFLHQMAFQSDFLKFRSREFWHRMPTLFVAIRAFGAPVLSCYAAQIICSLLALIAVVLVWRSAVSTEIKAAALAAATFLATPYAWDYDTVILIFAAAWLGREGMRTGFLPWERIAVVGLLVFPLITIVASVHLGVQPGPLILWLVLLLLVRRAVGNPAALGTAATSGEAIRRPA